MTDQELKDLVAGLAVSQAATAKTLDQISQELKYFAANSTAKADRLDAQLAAAGVRMAQTDAQMAENAVRMAQTDAQMAKTDEKIKRLSELYGNVADNQGSVAEEFFFNTLSANPVIGTIKYNRVTPNLIVGKAGKQSEFDLVLVNGNSVALIEVKHKAHLSALDQLDQQLGRYRSLIPEHASYTLYGGIAGLSVPAATVAEAHKRGMFVLKQQGQAFAVDVSSMRAF